MRLKHGIVQSLGEDSLPGRQCWLLGVSFVLEGALRLCACSDGAHQSRATRRWRIPLPDREWKRAEIPAMSRRELKACALSDRVNRLCIFFNLGFGRFLWAGIPRIRLPLGWASIRSRCALSGLGTGRCPKLGGVGGSIGGSSSRPKSAPSPQVPVAAWDPAPSIAKKRPRENRDLLKRSYGSSGLESRSPTTI